MNMKIKNLQNIEDLSYKFVIKNFKFKQIKLKNQRFNFILKDFFVQVIGFQ